MSWLAHVFRIVNNSEQFGSDSIGLSSAKMQSGGDFV